MTPPKVPKMPIHKTWAHWGEKGLLGSLPPPNPTSRRVPYDPAALLNNARATGVTLWADGDALRYRGPREALAKLLPALKAHKPAILVALAHPNLSGVSPEFAARLSAEDLDDTAAGDIPVWSRGRTQMQRCRGDLCP